MKDYEITIIEKLTEIDINSYNISKQKIKKRYNDLRKIAIDNKDEKWKKMIDSEEAYYNEDYDKAFELNEEAYKLDSENPVNMRCAYIIQGLATIYSNNKIYNKSEELYKEAIEVNPDCYQAYVDLITQYRKIKNYHASREMLKILKEKVDSNSPYYYIALETEARLLIAEGEYENANSILLGIVANPQCVNDAGFLEVLGLSYALLGDKTNAIKTYKRAMDICEFDDLKNFLENKYRLLNFPDNKVLLSDMEAIMKLPIEELDTLSTICDYYTAENTIVAKYAENFKKTKKLRTDEHSNNYILCLKGWSSSVPELLYGLDWNYSKRGGGFFVKYEGVGIAIDPGMNYIENLHENKLFINDIDVVIVTHSHIDHNNDVARICDMAYQLKKEIKFFIDNESYKTYIQHLEVFEKKYSGNVVKIFDEFKKLDIVWKDKKIPMLICKTYHDCPGSFGIKLHFGKKVFGYTSDTEYRKEIGNFFSDTDILLANLSETTPTDFLFLETKSNHLGLSGIKNILEMNIKEDVTCLISEFWGGFQDMRLELTSRLKTKLNDEKYNLIPTDIGIKYYINDGYVICNNCGERVYGKNLNFARIFSKSSRLICMCNKCIYRNMS